MKKILNKTNLLVAFLFALIACLTASAATLKLTVHAQEEKPTSVVTLTSYTSILNVDEDYQFAALVTNENDSTSTTVTWTSSNEAAVEIDSEGLAYANAEGNATITATAADGAYASIDVLVSKTAIRVTSVEVYPEEIEMKTKWTTRLGYNVFPQDAYEKSVFWTSSDTSVVTVNTEGYITSVAAGTATVTVTTRDNLEKAECKVTVYADTALAEATLTPATLTMSLPQYTENEFTLNLPNDETGTPIEIVGLPQWYTANDSIVSIDSTGYTGLTFSGDWKPEDTEGETDYFTNSNDNSVLYWVGDYTMNVTDITVSFSFTFNDKGVLTNVDVTIVSVTERTETAE